MPRVQPLSVGNGQSINVTLFFVTGFLLVLCFYRVRSRDCCTYIGNEALFGSKIRFKTRPNISGHVHIRQFTASRSATAGTQGLKLAPLTRLNLLMGCRLPSSDSCVRLPFFLIATYPILNDSFIMNTVLGTSLNF